MTHSRRKFTLAFEEEASGKTVAELERTFYARLESATALDHARDTAEKHEQWEFRIPKSDDNTPGRVRVRRTEFADGRVEFVQTIKINRAGSQVGNSQVDETSISVSEAVFQQFRIMATHGMIKTRYTYYVMPEGADVDLGNVTENQKKLEVDVFPMADGKLANWVKIDYEYSPGEPDRPPYFPTGFVDIIDGDTQDPKDRDFIQKLYGDLFLAKVTR